MIKHGDFEVSSVEYTNQFVPGTNEESFQVDHFPSFTVTGKWRGHEFKREVALELDGRDADEKHIDGYDLSDDEADGEADTCDLYSCVYDSEAYKELVRKFQEFYATH